MRCRLLGLSLLAVALAGCGSSGAGSSVAPIGTGRAGSAGPSADDLVITVTQEPGATPRRDALQCDGSRSSGTLPDPAAACAALGAMAAPFAPLPSGVACSQVYGGPQTATITGTWHGRAVDVALSRTDGCRVEQWNRLAVLLPGTVPGGS